MASDFSRGRIAPEGVEPSSDHRVLNDGSVRARRFLPDDRISCCSLGSWRRWSRGWWRLVPWLLVRLDLLDPPLRRFILTELLRLPVLRCHHLLEQLNAPLRSFNLLDLLELLRIPLRRLHLASLFSGPLGPGVPVVSASISVCRWHQQPTAKHQANDTDT